MHRTHCLLQRFLCLRLPSVAVGLLFLAVGLCLTQSGQRVSANAVENDRAKPLLRESVHLSQKRPNLTVAPGAQLHVVDEQGKPVPKFDVIFWTSGRGRSSWESGRDGRLALSSSHTFGDAGAVNVVVRAPD